MTEAERAAKALSVALSGKGLTLSVAESFTGGLLSAAITAVAGASEYFKEGIVAYSPLSKEDRLKVGGDTINRCGAVSCAVAREMLNGLLADGCDFAAVTTGNAGPTAEKEGEVGVCYVGVADKTRLCVYRYVFAGNRREVMQKGTLAALNGLLDLCRQLNF